jgi:hypothetical protein
LDGRALGPDEQPPIIPNVVSQRATKHNVAPSAPALEVEKPVTPVETQRIDEKSTAKLGDKKNQTVKTKRQAKPASLENGLPTVSGRDQIEESRQEENKLPKEEESRQENKLTKEEESRQENKLTKEEVELARKIEELRKEKEAAMLKEQRRLEEKAKAKEAMERKKRNAEKAQARASLRAQREAEQKEKVNSENTPILSVVLSMSFQPCKYLAKICQCVKFCILAIFPVSLPSDILHVRI